MSDLIKANQVVGASSFSQLSETLSTLISDLENVNHLGDCQFTKLKKKLVEFKHNFDLFCCDGEYFTGCDISMDDPFDFEVHSAADSANGVDDAQIIEKLKMQVCRKIYELKKVRKEKAEAQRDSESTLFQLHCVQEHLERYVLLTRRQSEMLSESRALHARAIELLLNS